MRNQILILGFKGLIEGGRLIGDCLIRHFKNEKETGPS